MTEIEEVELKKYAYHKAKMDEARKQFAVEWQKVTGQMPSSMAILRRAKLVSLVEGIAWRLFIAGKGPNVS